MSRLADADKLKGTDGFRAYTIYDEVLSESSGHAITDDYLRDTLGNAARERDRLRPIAEQRLKDDRAKADREAEQQRSLAEAVKRKVAEAEQAKAARERDALRLQQRLALVRDRARLYAARPQRALGALKAVKKVQAHVQLGIGEAQYADVLSDAVVEVGEFAMSPDGRELTELSAQLSAAISKYKAAADRWTQSVEKLRKYAKLGSDLDILVAHEKYDCNTELQHLWGDADSHVKCAERLLDPDACEAMLTAMISVPEPDAAAGTEPTVPSREDRLPATTGDPNASVGR